MQSEKFKIEVGILLPNLCAEHGRMATRHHGWCLTINNPGPDQVGVFEQHRPEMDFGIVGRERAPSTGTIHLQAYVHWTAGKTMARMRAIFPRAHLTVALGTPHQNRDYCSKGGDVVFEWGEPPIQGRRVDVDSMRMLLQQGANMRQIAYVAQNAGALRLAENWMRMHEVPRDPNRPPEVRWYYGSSGSGKTKSALDWLGPDTYICLDKGKWWDGYDQHNGVLIDDFRDGWCTYNRLLQLLDRYPVTVEVKGGTRQLRAMKIAITAPDRPELYYPRIVEDKQQLLRRITQVIDVDNTCPLCGWEYGKDCMCQPDAHPELIESSDDESAVTAGTVPL